MPLSDTAKGILVGLGLLSGGVGAFEIYKLVTATTPPVKNVYAVTLTGSTSITQGNSASYVANVTLNGVAVDGTAVVLSISGPMTDSYTLNTDASGNASFSEVLTSSGSYSVQASAEGVTSNVISTTVSTSAPSCNCPTGDVCANSDGSCNSGYELDAGYSGCCKLISTTSNITVNLTASPVSVDQGDFVTFSITTTGGTGTPIYDLFIDGVVENNVPNPTQYSTEIIGSHSAYVIATYSNGIATSNTVTWNVIQVVPELALTVSPTTLQGSGSIAAVVTASNLPSGTSVSLVNKATGNTIDTAAYNGGTLAFNETLDNTGETLIVYQLVAQATVSATGELYTSNEVNVSVYPTAGYTLYLTASLYVVASGQGTTLSAQLSPAETGQPVTFLDNSTGAVIGSSNTDSSGIATYPVTLDYTGSGSEGVLIQATTSIGSKAYLSNVQTITVTGTQANNWGISCNRTGYYMCVAGAGMMSEAQCNSDYASLIGTVCK